MRHTTEEKLAILKQQGSMTMKELAAKSGVGLSTLTAWKAKLNHKQPKRKTAKRVKAARIVTKVLTNSEEQEWETLFNNYIFHRDEAEKARKALEKYVEQLR